MIRVLLIDDDEDDFVITRDMLTSHHRAQFSVDWSADYASALAEINTRRHDVYLVDYRLGERTGLELVREAFAGYAHAPIIMLTGQTAYEIDVQASAEGVTDFLEKQHLSSTVLERSIRYAIRHQGALSDLARSEERYALAARAVNDGIWEWDVGSGRAWFSARFHDMLGRSQADVLKHVEGWFELVHPDDLDGLRAAIGEHIAGETDVLESEHRMRHADGSWRTVLTRGLALRSDGGVTRMAGSMSDITERRHAERRLQHEALHDALTGLPNRAYFMSLVEQAERRYLADPRRSCAVMFLDIDRFKLVNDTFSHAVGDRLLEEAALRIAGAVRPRDVVARLGGDEFTILLEDLGTDRLSVVQTVATNVLDRLAAGFTIAGAEWSVSASIGIAIATPGVTAADLLRNADIAMYEAKRRGRAAMAMFDETMHSRVADRLTIETSLRGALRDSLLRVHYQPVMHIASGQLSGFEALARWPQGWQEVSPVDFVGVAEESGLIRTLGAYVMQVALRDLARWRARGLADANLRMSVNVSAGQLDDRKFPEQVIEAVHAAGVDGSSLHLEITEGTLMREPERMADATVALAGEGIRLQLDDFGTGYSSLSALRQFPVSALKIDRSFVANLPNDPDSQAIVRSTVALAHSLGMTVVAEGIEDADQLAYLRLLGCEYGQGYFFARPMSAEAVEQMLSLPATSARSDAAPLTRTPSHAW